MDAKIESEIQGSTPLNKGGRPRKHHSAEITEKLIAYIEQEAIPILAEFSYKNNIPRTHLYEIAKDDIKLTDAIKFCIAKKEANLERGALSGEVNTTMAIFSLKQIGWSDKQETTHLGGITIKATALDEQI